MPAVATSENTFDTRSHSRLNSGLPASLIEVAYVAELKLLIVHLWFFSSGRILHDRLSATGPFVGE
jgi:hypothetical protein